MPETPEPEPAVSGLPETTQEQAPEVEADPLGVSADAERQDPSPPGLPTEGEPPTSG